MNEWNSLYEKYPDLFKDVGGDPRSTCMAFGIECNIGWYDIISAVCWQIFQHERNITDRKKYREQQNASITKDFGIQIDGDEEDYQPVKFDQIKEKYGGLRIYYSGGDKYVQGVVSMAEEMSYKVCEVCGNPGKPNKGGWISTLCEHHREEQNNQVYKQTFYSYDNDTQ